MVWKVSMINVWVGLGPRAACVPLMVHVMLAAPGIFETMMASCEHLKYHRSPEHNLEKNDERTRASISGISSLHVLTKLYSLQP